MNKMSLQKSIQNFGIKQALKYMEKDPEENIPKLMDMVDKFAPDGWYEAQRNMIRKVIKERGNWYQLILRIYQLDPEVRKAFFQNFIFNASLKGSALQEQLAEENNCNIPRAILLDPTSTCINIHIGTKLLTLTYDRINRIQIQIQLMAILCCPASGTV